MSCNRTRSHEAACSTHVQLVYQLRLLPARRPLHSARKMTALTQSFQYQELTFSASYSSFPSTYICGNTFLPRKLRRANVKELSRISDDTLRHHPVNIDIPSP